MPELARKDTILEFANICFWLLIGSSGKIHQDAEVEIADVIFVNLER